MAVDTKKASTEVLVTFTYNDQHFYVDKYKSDRLPDETRSKKLYEPCWNHGCKVLIIRFYCFFNLLHIFSFKSIVTV